MDIDDTLELVLVSFHVDLGIVEAYRAAPFVGLGKEPAGESLFYSGGEDRVAWSIKY